MNAHTALVFPGQGSQSQGMLSDIAAEFSIVKKTFDEASHTLGYDLWAIVRDNPNNQLNQTEYTQPALLTASVALWRIVQDIQPIKPALLAGHSLGEYTALVCAGAMSFADGVDIVAKRGRYMQEAAPEGSGALAAIVGLEDDVVIAVCEEAKQSEIVVAANFNSPGQVVISGHVSAVDRALAIAKTKGAKLAKLLPISVPSHSPLMASAQQRLKNSLEKMTLHSPKIPVVNNVDVAINTDPEKIRDALIRQLTGPVQWVKTIQFFVKNGITTVAECGPGNVLTGLNKRIAKDLELITYSQLSALTVKDKEV